MNRQINLLPFELRRDPKVETRRLLVRSLLIALALALVLGGAVLFYQIYTLQRQLAEVQEELMRLQPVALQAQKVGEEIKQKEQETAHLQSVFNERSLWGVILDRINDRSPRDVWLTALSATEAGDFTLKGMANSLVSVGIFQNQLTQLPELEGISLKSAEKVSVGEVSLVKFEIAGRLRQGGE